LKSRTIKIVKRKKYRDSNIVNYEMMKPRTAEEISSHLSQYLDGITPSIVRALWKTGEMACGSANHNRSNYFYAEEYLESLQRKEDERKQKRKELEKKYGRF